MGRTSLVVQWLRLLLPKQGCRRGTVGLIPREGTRVPYAVWHAKKKIFLKGR